MSCNLRIIERSAKLEQPIIWPDQVTETIYFDYAATTPVDPVVVDAMVSCMGPTGVFGNPASHTHLPGQSAEKAVAHARTLVADLITANPDEIVWTSGATESINLAIKGVALSTRHKRPHILTSCLEHNAVLDSCRHLASLGYEITFLNPNDDGAITPAQVTDALRDETILVSLMHVNNETGTITDVASIGDVLRARGIPFHVDAVQSAARLQLSAESINADLISISAHKMYGPKGIGALYIRRKSAPDLEPQIHGGSQEQGLRAGTIATHQVVGMGKASELLTHSREAEMARVATLECTLLAELTSIQDTRINGTAKRIPGIVSVRFNDVDNESLMLSLRDEVAVSAGSACTSAKIEPSHVLLGLGLNEDQANSSIRISIGRFTSLSEVNRAAICIRDAVDELRTLRHINSNGHST